MYVVLCNKVSYPLANLDTSGPGFRTTVISRGYNYVENTDRKSDVRAKNPISSRRGRCGVFNGSADVLFVFVRLCMFCTTLLLFSTCSSSNCLERNHSGSLWHEWAHEEGTCRFRYVFNKSDNLIKR